MSDCYLIAMGPGGVRLARAALWSCLAGTLRADALHITVIGADAAALAQQAAAYTVVTGAVAQAGAGHYPPVKVESAGEEPLSLNLRAREEADRLLSKALFTREEAGLLPAQDLGGSGPIAALAWAERLQGEGIPVLDAAKHGDAVVLCGSLCDAACAAGATPVRAWLREKHPQADVSGVFLLPVKEQDQAGLCREALMGLHERDWRALCLAGMAEDCRDARPEAAHLADWMAACCLDAVLCGAEGAHSVRVAADRLDWADFGTEAERYGVKWDGLLRTAWLVLAEYGVGTLERLSSPNWLRDRMGWYGAFFGASRQQPQAQRDAQADVMRAAVSLMGAYAGWMHEVCAGLPVPMQWANSLDGARQEAAAHYVQVLELAGRLALLEHDAEAGDMANEHFVHRHDLADSAAEATIRRIGEMKEELAALAQEQEALDKRIGGRAQRGVLAEAIRLCSAEAEELRSEAEEARRRIERAARIATPEEMPRVEVARSKLERLERHLAVLDGRTARARADLAQAMTDEVRNRPPEVTEEMQVTPVPPLYDLETLALMRDVPCAEIKEMKKRAAAVGQKWLWKTPQRAVMERIAKRGEPGAVPAGALLSAIMMTEEGRSTYVDAENGRPGAPA